MNKTKARKVKSKILKEFQDGYYKPQKKSDEYKQVITSKTNGLYYQFGSDNPILFTIEVYALLDELGLFNKSDAKRLHRAIRKLSRRESGGLGKDIVRGLFNRNPSKDNRKDQWDNYEAIACSVMFGKEFKKYAQEIDDYGRRFFWPSYDNRAPYKFSVHSLFKPFFNWRYFECCRQGWNIFTYRACVGRRCGLFNFLWYVGKVLCENNDPSETTGKLISWLRYKAIGHKWYVKPLKWLFERKMRKMYGKNWIARLIAGYHGSKSTIFELAMCLEE